MTYCCFYFQCVCPALGFIDCCLAGFLLAFDVYALELFPEIIFLVSLIALQLFVPFPPCLFNSCGFLLFRFYFEAGAILL